MYLFSSANTFAQSLAQLGESPALQRARTLLGDAHRPGDLGQRLATVSIRTVNIGILDKVNGARDNLTFLLREALQGLIEERMALAFGENLDVFSLELCPSLLRKPLVTVSTVVVALLQDIQSAVRVLVVHRFLGTRNGGLDPLAGMPKGFDNLPLRDVEMNPDLFVGRCPPPPQLLAL